MPRRFFAITEAKRLRSLPKGTTILATEPQEDYGGYGRTTMLYVYDVKLEPNQVQGRGPEHFQLAEEIAFRKARYGDGLMPLGRLEELEEKLEERDNEFFERDGGER
ncbi:MAG: hypothetical protein AAFX50_13455 [Acidobacteriota bacterium]